MYHVTLHLLWTKTMWLTNPLGFVSVLWKRGLLLWHAMSHPTTNSHVGKPKTLLLFTPGYNFLLTSPWSTTVLYTIKSVYINRSYSVCQQPNKPLLLNDPPLPTQTLHSWQQRNTLFPDLDLATCQNSSMINLFWAALNAFPFSLGK